MAIQFGQAIAKTRKYFGLKSLRGTVGNGPMAKEEIEWDPKFIDWSKDQTGQYLPRYFRMPREGKEPLYLPAKDTNPDTAVAITLPNGDTKILVSAFTDSQRFGLGAARVLAMNLQHEALHFAQLAAEGWVSSAEEEEERAWKETLESANALGLNETERRVFENHETHYAQLVKLAHDHPNDPRYRLRPPFPNPKNADFYKKEFENGESKSLAIHEARGTLSYKYFELERRIKEMQEKEQAERLSDIMSDIARRMCREPWTVTQLELDQLPFPSSRFLCPKRPPMDIVCPSLVYGKLRQSLCQPPGRPSVRDLRAMAAGNRGLDRAPLTGSSLAALAVHACEGPRRLEQNDLDERLEGDFPTRHILQAEEAGQGLSGCAKDLYAKLLETNEILLFNNQMRLNIDWLNWWSDKLLHKWVRPILLGDLLANFTHKACAEPGNITRNVMWRSLAASYPNPIIDRAQEAGQRLSGCARELYYNLIEINDRLMSNDQELNFDWLNYEAKRLSEKYSQPPDYTPPANNEKPTRPGRDDSPGCGPCRDCGSGCGRPRPRFP